ncbi:Ig-like domain-containing protein [Dethiosulfatibacter aminovorans DSM 17477]|uniref:Ig-like domain-containing protein n=1 Tax=Dethiosulfatibacter aminovorans DSM 17477 TaxID=1121476 RepID=A0A1M6AEL4_9FIRM|nr:Ig-like domain-containing protein [Dethiosulfatibacter aminovorans]SHI34899.1 Ig-like domain-containing protein [Dethiosulfatibacter aminovorans DSM 17477]
MKKTLVLVMALTLLLSIFTVAEGTEGNKPLFLDVSTPEDGAADIPVEQEIKLVFSKNVVNVSVKDNNLKCFTMEDSDGYDVPIEIVMGDDQIHPDQKRDIVIKPVEGLKEDMTYTIRISPDMLAKNGNTLGEEVMVTFSTMSTNPTSSLSTFNGTGIAMIALLIVVIVTIFIRKRKSK